MEENIIAKVAKITLRNNYTINNVTCYCCMYTTHCECEATGEIVEELFNNGIGYHVVPEDEYKPGHSGYRLFFRVNISQLKSIYFI